MRDITFLNGEMFDWCQETIQFMVLTRMLACSVLIDDWITNDINYFYGTSRNFIVHNWEDAKEYYKKCKFKLEYIYGCNLPEELEI